jgi:hypothetical protein
MEASNSFEKMLTHQLGLMHHLTMKMGAQAIRHVERLGQANLTHAEAQRISTEAARLGNATARMTVTYQQGMTTLQRLPVRRGPEDPGAACDRWRTAGRPSWPVR